MALENVHFVVMVLVQRSSKALQFSESRYYIALVGNISYLKLLEWTEVYIRLKVIATFANVLQAGRMKRFLHVYPYTLFVVTQVNFTSLFYIDDNGLLVC